MCNKNVVTNLTFSLSLLDFGKKYPSILTPLYLHYNGPVQPEVVQRALEELCSSLPFRKPGRKHKGRPVSRFFGIVARLLNDSAYRFRSLQMDNVVTHALCCFGSEHSKHGVECEALSDSVCIQVTADTKVKTYRCFDAD